MKKLIIVAITLLVVAFPLVAGATTILEMDYKLYEADGGLADSSLLSGFAEIDFNPSTYELIITLINTTPKTAFSGESSSAWFTGLGIYLPAGLSVTGGKVELTDGSAVYKGTTLVYTAPFDVSQEWGYMNGTSGHFNDFSGYFDTNTQFSTMVADTDTKFASGSLDSVIDLDGPPWGLLSSDPGAYGIVNGITITASLTGSYSGDLETFINDHDVVFTFGSPNAIPEPSTMILLGSSLIAVGILGRRKTKR